MSDDCSGIDNARRPLYDRDELLDRMMGNVDVLAAAIEAFAADFEATRLDCQRALEQRDAETLRRINHRLCGSLGLFGAVDVIRVGQSVADHCADGVLADDCDQHVHQLIDLTDHLIGELRALVEAEQTDP